MPEIIYYIYVISNSVNDKLYIGQTKEPKNRWKAHRSKTSDKCMAISRSIHKHGAANFTFTLIACCSSREDADYTETEMIKQYNSLTPNGYNITPGGFSIKYDGADLYKYCTGMMKLNKEKVLYIASQFSSKTDDELAAEMSVASITIKGIRNGTRWGHITKIPRNVRPIIRWTEQEKKTIALMYKSTYDVRAIANAFNREYQAVYDLLRALGIKKTNN